MINYKFYSKFFAFLTSGVVIFSVCGCSKKKDSVSSSVSSLGNVVTTLNTTVVTTSSTINSTTSSSKKYIDTVVGTIPTYSYNDMVVMNRFKYLGDEIKENYNSEILLEKGKLYFIYCVDFLFYDGEINGVKFDDMTDMARQQLLSDISTIDSLICSKYPDYKEKISSGSGLAYDKASELISSGSENIKEFSKDMLGEENYSKLEKYKDLFIEQTVDDYNSFTDLLDSGYNKGKSKFDDWYNQFKGQ